jgi:hypothetical protein
VGGRQLLVGGIVVGALLASVVRICAGCKDDDGAAAHPVEELRVEVVIGEPEELVVVAGMQPDGTVDHHGFRL